MCLDLLRLMFFLSFLFILKFIGWKWPNMTRIQKSYKHFWSKTQRHPQDEFGIPFHDIGRKTWWYEIQERNTREKKFICARSFIAPRTSLPFGHAHFCRRGRAECQEEFTTGRWAPLEGKRYQRYHRRGFLSLTSARRRRSNDDCRNLAAAWELYSSARDRSEVTDIHTSYSAAQETKWSLSTSPIYLEDGIEAVVIKQASVLAARPVALQNLQLCCDE